VTVPSAAGRVGYRRGNVKTISIVGIDEADHPPGEYVVTRIVFRTNSGDLSGMGPVRLLTRAQLMSAMKFSPSLKPGIWGAVIGATVISVLGFSLFGWTLDSTAEKMAKERALTAVVEMLAPICADRFQQQADAPAKLKEFGKASIWDRRSSIEKGTWATVPGTDTPNSAVVTACAERLARLL
jgi:hypothetical protein